MHNDLKDVMTMTYDRELQFVDRGLNSLSGCVTYKQDISGISQVQLQVHHFTQDITLHGFVVVYMCH